MALVPLGGGVSGGCARGSDTSGRPSQWSLPQPCITAGMQGRTRRTKPKKTEDDKLEAGHPLGARASEEARGAAAPGLWCLAFVVLAGVSGEDVEDLQFSRLIFLLGY